MFNIKSINVDYKVQGQLIGNNAVKVISTDQGH